MLLLLALSKQLAVQSEANGAIIFIPTIPSFGKASKILLIVNEVLPRKLEQEQENVGNAEFAPSSKPVSMKTQRRCLNQYYSCCYSA